MTPKPHATLPSSFSDHLSDHLRENANPFAIKRGGQCFRFFLSVLGCVIFMGCQFDPPSPEGTSELPPSTSTPKPQLPAEPTTEQHSFNQTTTSQARQRQPPPSSSSAATASQEAAADSVQANDASNKSRTTAQATPQTAPPKVIHRRGKKYFAGQLHYNLTTGLLVFEADIRARRIVKKYLPYMDQAQADRAVKLATSYDPEFQRLRRERAQHFAGANAASTLAEKLLDNQLDIIDLVAKIRLRIATEIMTKEQIKSARAYFQRESAFPQ